MIYLNGKFQPIEEAYIPVLDRGFIFGDGIYELLPVYSQHPFRLKEHLKRLENNLNAVQIKNPHTEAEWSKLIYEMIKRNPGEDQYVYIQVTRGVAKRDHAFPANITPTVFMMSSVLVTPPKELCKTGIHAVTATDNRWLRCDIKSTSLLANVLLRQFAIDNNAAESVLLRDGFLTEGSASNIFIVHGNTVIAPPKDNLMLPGITYDVVLELIKTNKIPCEVRKIPERELRRAEEVWLTSSTKEVLPITTLDGKPVGDGKPGPLFAKVYDLYQNYKEQVMRMPLPA
jgi:D-alanine transaminase